MNRASVTLSPSAARRINAIAAAEGRPLMLRVAVEGGGCSGFQYKFDLVDAADEDDLKVECDGAAALVDVISLALLNGSEIDFADELAAAEFRVRNPNAKSSCGCGVSFRSERAAFARAAPAAKVAPMRIATWNVNSVNARLETVLGWFRNEQPDVACLQEIKCVDEKFPAAEFERLGYNVAVHGQKTYNGVALLSKTPLEDVRKGLPGDDADDHARYIEAVISGPTPVRVASIYLPNGNPIGTDKFAYKLKWMDRLARHAAELLAFEEPLTLCGDYNVIPEPADADQPASWLGDALFQPETRAAFRGLQWLGLTDAYMQVDGAPGGYTFWDYQAGAWQRNHGIRIDHLLLSAQASDRLRGVLFHKDARGLDKPSDHVPVVAELALCRPLRAAGPLARRFSETSSA